MKYQERNRLAMYRVTLKVCLTFDSIWGNMPSAVRNVKQLEVNIGKIQETLVEQEKDLKGITQDKAEVRSKMIDDAVDVSFALVVLGLESEDINYTLIEEVNFTYSDYTRAGEEDLLAMVQLVLNRALEPANFALLQSDYEIEEAQITRLATLTDEFNNAIGSPREAQNLKTVQTLKINRLDKETTSIVNERLDRLFYRYRLTKIEFFNAYTKAREIVDRRATASSTPTPNEEEINTETETDESETPSTEETPLEDINTEDRPPE